MSIILRDDDHQQTVSVSVKEAEQARDLATRLDRGDQEFTLALGGREPRPLNLELTQLFIRLVHAVASGKAITVTSLPDELSTTSAARLIGISRPTLMKLIKSGEVPSRKVGSHSRVRTVDAMRHLRARWEKQQAAFGELRELERALEG